MSVKDELINRYLETDEYYQSLATPLKNAKMVKQAHKQELEEMLKFEDLQIKVEKAKELIEETSEADNLFEKLRSLTSSQIDKLDDKTSIQNIADISDDTLSTLHNLGISLIKENRTIESEALYTFLMLLNTSSPRTWMGLMASYFGNNKFQECKQIAQLVKEMVPELAAGFLFSLLASQKLGEEEIPTDRETLTKIFDDSPAEKEVWSNTLKVLK